MTLQTITIEHSIFKSLLFDEGYARKVVPYLDATVFEGIHKTFFQVYEQIFSTYNKIPTIEALAVSFQKQQISETDFSDLTEFLSDIYKDKTQLPDTQWLIDETESFCKDKKIYNAIYESINILEGSNKNLDKGSIPSLLEEALAIDFSSNIGMDFFEDAERRFDLYTAENNRIRFPLEALNILSNGGLKKKSLSAILAGTNVGKSALMCFLAGEFLRIGHNVLYITLEMSEDQIQERIEANLLDITTDNLKLLKKADYLSKINQIRKNTTGRFIAKEYPTSSAGANHFRHLIRELKQKKKFVADIIFVDYINICCSSRYKSLSGVNSYSYIKAIAEELRGLACELDVPIVTATQTNREGSKGKDVDMTSTSESFGLPMSLDWFIAIVSDQVLQDNNQQLVTLLKTRWGNKSKAKPQLISVDWDKMRYKDVVSSQSSDVESVKNLVGKGTKTTKKVDASEIEWD